MIYFRIFKALLWKEYREARSIWLLSIPTVIIVILMSMERSNVGWRYSISWDILYITIFAFGFLFFLPLISRESEYDTLINLRTKPIAPELYGFLNWLSAIVLLVAPFLFFMGLFYLLNSSRMLGVHKITDSQYVALTFYALIFVIASSAFHYCISSATSNRFRSFGLWLVTVFLFGVGIEYITHKIAQNIIPTFFNRIQFFIESHLFTTYLLLAILFFTLALALIRLRMTHTIRYWPVYTAVPVVSLCLFLILAYFATRNVNVTLLDVHSPQAAALIEEIVREDVLREYMYDKDIRGRVISDATHIESRWGFIPEEPPLNKTDYARFVVEHRANGGWKTLFSESLYDLFNAENLPNNQMYEEYYVWKHGIWRGLDLTENYGLVLNMRPFWYNLFTEYQAEFNVGPDYFQAIQTPSLKLPLEILQKMSDEELHQWYQNHYSDFIRYAEQRTGREVTIKYNFHPRVYIHPKFIGHYTRNQQPQFTPVEEIEFTYYTSGGQVTNSTQSIAPGVFLTMDASHMFHELPGVYIQDDYMKPALEVYQEYDIESGAHTIRTSAHSVLKISSLFEFSFGDNFNQNRTFAYDYMLQETPTDPNYFGPAQYHKIPRLYCFDLSDPKKLYISIGCKFIEPFPHFNDYYYWNTRLAVENDLLILLLRGHSGHQLSVIDVSDPQNMHEIKRERVSFWQDYMNWSYYSGEMRYTHDMFFERDKLILINPFYLQVFEVSADGDVTPFARIVNTRPSQEIRNVAREGNELLLFYKDSLIERYAIGPAPAGEKAVARVPVYLQETAAYKETLARYKASQTTDPEGDPS